MPTSKPRFIITLESDEQHQLLKEFARLQGRSVSYLVNELLREALRPLVAMRRLAANPSAQMDLVEFLKAVTGISGAAAEPDTQAPSLPGGPVPPEPSQAPQEGVEARASIPRSRRASEPSRRRSSPPEGQPTPVGNTGVTFPAEGVPLSGSRPSRRG